MLQEIWTQLQRNMIDGKFERRLNTQIDHFVKEFNVSGVLDIVIDHHLSFHPEQNRHGSING